MLRLQRYLGRVRVPLRRLSVSSWQTVFWSSIQYHGATTSMTPSDSSPHSQPPKWTKNSNRARQANPQRNSHNNNHNLGKVVGVVTARTMLWMLRCGRSALWSTITTCYKPHRKIVDAEGTTCCWASRCLIRIDTTSKRLCGYRWRIWRTTHSSALLRGQDTISSGLD